MKDIKGKREYKEKSLQNFMLFNNGFHLNLQDLYHIRTLLSRYIALFMENLSNTLSKLENP